MLLDGYFFSATWLPKSGFPLAAQRSVRPPFCAGIRRDSRGIWMPLTALLGLPWARVQVLQKTPPMKCAGVAGRRVRARRG